MHNLIDWRGWMVIGWAIVIAIVLDILGILAIHFAKVYARKKANRKN